MNDLVSNLSTLKVDTPEQYPGSENNYIEVDKDHNKINIDKYNYRVTRREVMNNE